MCITSRILPYVFYIKHLFIFTCVQVSKVPVENLDINALTSGSGTVASVGTTLSIVSAITSVTAQGGSNASQSTSAPKQAADAVVLAIEADKDMPANFDPFKAGCEIYLILFE